MRSEIDVIIHATEDYNKILTSLKNVLKLDTNRIERRDLSGHYGNPLIYCRIKLRSDETKQLLHNIREKIEKEDYYYLMNFIEEYYYNNTFYLRLDKQMLCRNIVKLVVNDPLKITVRNINLDSLKKILFG